MQGLKVKFEETLAARWPEFKYHTRYYHSSPATLAKELKAFRFGAEPPATNPPSSKTSKQSALPSWRVMYASPQIKQIADPAKMTGSPAPEKKKESDQDEEVVDDAQLENALSQPQPEAEQPQPEVEQPKPQSQQESPKSQHDSPKSQGQQDYPKTPS